MGPPEESPPCQGGVVVVRVHHHHQPLGERPQLRTDDIHTTVVGPSPTLGDHEHQLPKGKPKDDLPCNVGTRPEPGTAGRLLAFDSRFASDGDGEWRTRPQPDHPSNITPRRKVMTQLIPTQSGWIRRYDDRHTAGQM